MFVFFFVAIAEPIRAAGASEEMHTIGNYSHLDAGQLGQPGAYVLHMV